MSDARDRNDASDSKDVLDRALAALHGEQPPAGPSDDVVAGTLGALSQHESQNERPTLFTRILTMTLTQRIAAAVMLTAGGLVIWFMFALFGGFGTVSYAQVAQQIKDARSMTFKMTTTSPQIPQPIETKIFALEPGMMRNEGPGGVVTVSRREGERMRVLAIEPRSKTAQLIEAKLTEAAGQNPDFVAEFRRLADKPGEPLGERQVGDVKARGFKVVTDGQTVSVWAHPKTALPILVEMDVPSVGGTVVMSEIAFDLPLDAKLFSLEPPAGFKLTETKLAVTLDLEANVINLLGAYTKVTDGTFPDKLDDWAAYGKALAGANAKPDDATMQALSGAGAITAILSNRKPGEDYGYTGKGAKLGDKDAIVFWHRDKTAGTYRAVFADLIAKPVTAEVVKKAQ